MPKGHSKTHLQNRMIRSAEVVGIPQVMAELVLEVSELPQNQRDMQND